MKISELKVYIEHELNDVYTKSELTMVCKQLFIKFLNLSQIDLMVKKDLIVNKLNLEIVKTAVSRLKENEPLDYVIGEIEFLGLKLWVNSSVLIPRPETEDLVNLVFNLWGNKSRPETIVDLGTGSACIALALKNIFTKTDVWAFDISESALKTAQYNSKITGLDINIEKFDMLGVLDLPINKKIDVLVSNPPYVLYEEKSEMHPRVFEYEPEIALFTSLDDDLQYYNVLRDYIIRFLSEGGIFIFEYNSKLTSKMLNLFSDLEDYILDLRIHKDCFGRDRFISGVRTSYFKC